MAYLAEFPGYSAGVESSYCRSGHTHTCGGTHRRDIAYICGKGKCVGADIDGRIQHIIRYHILQVPLLGGDDNLPRDDDADGGVVSHNMV